MTVIKNGRCIYIKRKNGLLYFSVRESALLLNISNSRLIDLIKISEKMVERGEQPAISLPEKIGGDKYYSLNAVKYIAKVIVNFRYGDFAKYRQGKKCSDKDCKVKGESSQRIGDDDNG